MNAHIAEPNYVEKVYRALEQANPNDQASEIWNDEAIQQLANYLDANDYDEVDLVTIPVLYSMYDLLKYTADNK